MTHLADSGPAGPNPIASRSVAELRRVVLFLCVGLVGLAVDTALFLEFQRAGLSLAVARAASLPLAMGVTYGLNRAFTFDATVGSAGKQFGRYALVTLAAQGISYGVFLALSASAPALPPVAAIVAGAIVATAFSFTGQRLFTFRGV